VMSRVFFFSSRRRHTILVSDWSSDVCSSDLESWTAGAIVATARDVAAFLDGLLGGALLPPACLALMTHATEHLDDHRRRGVGMRSEERRVGKEGRARRSPYQ